MKLIKENIKFLWFWGESAFPYFFFLIKYLELNNEDQIAKSLLNSLFLNIISYNSNNSQNGLPNPYYNVNDVLLAVLGIDVSKIDFKEFVGSSYILETISLMIARRNDRELLENNWRGLSHIQLREFRPEKIEDTFLWHVEHGTNYSKFLNATQSWAKLKEKAQNLNNVSNLFSEHYKLLHFFILVCPHRINKFIIGLLDKKTNLYKDEKVSKAKGQKESFN